MNQMALIDGVERRRDLSQYYTPPHLASMIAEWTLRHHPDVSSILEPAAGEGALIKPLLQLRPDLRITAYDLDPRNVEQLLVLGPQVTAICADFLNAPHGCHDITVMNSPYEAGADVAFVLEALERTPVAVALLRGVIRHGSGRWTVLWRHVDIVREVVLSERPSFGGQHNPKQDFCILELRRRERPRERGEAMTVRSTEWW